MERTKTNGKRNRAAGHKLETDMVSVFKKAGYPHVITCRAGDRSRDAQGIDLMNCNELDNGRFPFNVQCKSYSSSIKYWDLLGRLPRIVNVFNVVIHKFTQKKMTTTGKGIFHPVGEYAILPLEDFITLITRAKLLSDEVMSTTTSDDITT